MDARAIATESAVDRRTANERFKEAFDGWLWGSFIVATVLHLAVFALWPTMTAADIPEPVVAPDIIHMDDFELPPPPEEIAPPAEPVIVEGDVDPETTIGPTTFDANPVGTLPPPPSGTDTARDLANTPGFAPYTVAPLLTNRDEVGRTLERTYPAVLRDAGIGGTVMVHVHVDLEGRVDDVRVETSSNHAQLDEAALKVARTMEFTPAMNRDVKVAVWIAIPVIFQIR